MPCRLIYYAQMTCIWLSVKQFFSMDQLKISKLTSFMRWLTVIFTFNLFSSFSKSVLKNKYKIKNINDFCDKFVCILQYFVVCCANDKVMCFFSTNDVIHLIIHSTFFFQKLCNNCWWLIVENMWKTFMFNSVTILSFFLISNCMNLFDYKLQRSFHWVVQSDFHLKSKKPVVMFY